MPQIPSDADIAKNVQHVLIDHGVKGTQFNKFLRELWDLERHHVNNMLLGDHYIKPEYLRVLAETAEVDMADFYK